MSDNSISASTYLKFLPAIYRSSNEEAAELPLVATYLKIFEKLLSGIADDSALSPTSRTYLARKGIRELLDPYVISTLFHPRLDFLFADDPSVTDTFTPPLSISSTSPTHDNLGKLRLLATYIGAEDVPSVKEWLSDFLDWIASTIALDVDQGWGIDTKRFVIAQALPLFRARGTVDGMTWLLNAWFGLDQDAPIGLAPDSGLKVLRIFASNPSFLPIQVWDSIKADSLLLVDDRSKSNAQLPDIVCFEADDETIERAVGYQAWYFVVTIVTSAMQDPPTASDEAALARFKRAVQSVVDEFKPALTEYDIRVGKTHRPPPPPPPPPGPDPESLMDRCAALPKPRA